ncbi:MAG: hypothetical protein MZU95_05720 [Desulfomicrobium escambiense]|nr:hypothetical protein [Desulfomicrobium escambiense]
MNPWVTIFWFEPNRLPTPQGPSSIATGAAPAKLGVPGEDRYYGRGVSPAPPATPHPTADAALLSWAEATAP